MQFWIQKPEPSSLSPQPLLLHPNIHHVGSEAQSHRSTGPFNLMWFFFFFCHLLLQQWGWAEDDKWSSECFTVEPLRGLPCTWGGGNSSHLQARQLCCCSSEPEPLYAPVACSLDQQVKLICGNIRVIVYQKRVIGTTLSALLLTLQNQSRLLSDIAVVELVWWVVLSFRAQARSADALKVIVWVTRHCEGGTRKRWIFFGFF